jgi:gliding motility-associated-like protein
MQFAVPMHGADDEVGVAVTLDSAGNQYITGTFDGTADFDPGPGVYNMTPVPGTLHDIFLVKLDTAQNLLWAKQWGSPGADWTYSVQLDTAGNVCVCGTFSLTADFDPGPGTFNMTASGSYDGFVLKLDPNGNFIWAIQITGPGPQWITAMRPAQNGDIIVAGFTSGVTDFDPGPATYNLSTTANDAFVARYDFSGNLVWVKLIGGSSNGDEWAFGLAMENNGNLLITGSFWGTTDFDPGPGVFSLTAASGVTDIYVAKLDAAGNFIWARAFSGNSNNNKGNCVFPDSSGNVYITGEFRGTCDFDPGPGINNLTVPANNQEDFFLTKLDSAGNLIWAFALGRYGTERGYSLGIDTLQNIFVTGCLASDSIDFDPTSGTYWVGPGFNTLSSFVAKYSPSGSIICAFYIESTNITKWTMSQQLIVKGETAYLTGGYRSNFDFDLCPPQHILNNVGNDDVYVTAYNFHNCNCSIPLTSTSSSSNVQCNGACDGFASVNAQGGALPYTYSWLPTGGTNNTSSNLCPGTYTCIVTDAVGDSVSIAFTITQPTALNTGITGTDLLCNSVCNGSAQLSVSGGSPGYTYNWSNSQSTTTISALCAGSYSVLVTDANGCTSSQSISITQPTPLVASVSATPTPCYSNSGAVATNASGGTGTLSYLWQPGGYSTPSVSNLAAGIYTVTITDQNGCTQVLSDTVISIGAPVTIATGIIDVVCHSDSTGAATVNASGSGPFTYQWSPFGGNNSGATNLTAGTYTVLVTDNQGCTQTQLVSISEPTSISVSVSKSNDSCTTGSGSISLVTAGGVGPYTYLWSNSQSSSVITGLSGGTFSVTITDSNGCTLDTSASIISTVAPALSVASFNDVLCFGDSTGSATVGAIGGTGPFNFVWQPFGSTAASASGLSAGTYSVIVTGADGCADSIALAINQPLQLLVTCQSADENCNYQDGSAFVNASGGIGTYNYVWSNSSSGDSIFQLSAGTYSVVITDQNGCSEMCSVTVNTTATANADAGTDINIVEGQTAVLYGSGGVYYSWQPASDVACNTCAATVASPSVTTTFVLTVTDSAGCMDVDTIVVFVEIPCDDIFVPNAFSPNGDGQNDFLYVRGDCIETFTFSVYNRWGEKVFQTSDQSVGWDGTWRGVACENAVFTYLVEGYSTNADPFKVTGNVSLVK